MIEGIAAYASVPDIPGPVDMATIYVPPNIAGNVMPQLAEKQIREVWLNPGADDDRLVARARAVGIEPILGCGILGIGENPGDYSLPPTDCPRCGSRHGAGDQNQAAAAN